LDILHLAAPCRNVPVTFTLDRMEYTVSKIEAAVDQMDWAIRLFIDHRAYIPAITLAGAAEEIIGQTLADESAFAILKQRICARTGLPENIVSQSHLNRAKNWAKHWQGMRDDETINLELETEAIQYIVRAISNLVAHDRSIPSEAPRFFAWLRASRSDLHAV
jgi:hypothetical protein